MSEYDCGHCPLGGIGEPVMVDGFPTHPDCAKAVEGMPPEQRERVRADVLEYVKDPEVYEASHAGPVL